ncbi:type II toxin-antitoxin system RelE/ParE family toxin [Rhodoplanes sp. Z2-YC6860]|uniref:type II toxin-antitoxin system RelE/ParE family toxin n=1 Tax=Rhodoplanes sp. Z2-YC6860 TaxID=674703 RepID=UPI00078BD190|nr:type II toxin-antitoxin system RelE/ParE family toxin [Rhodoplanes sp. Z2-YC6860]AMN40839.1 plasmid stabilization system protein [Rhodoplanes sp. Z2-YC6860]
MKLLVAEAAQADLQRLHTFLSDVNLESAHRAVAAITNAIDSLDLFPDRGRPSPIPFIRELIVPFGSSNYVVRYTHNAERDELIVLRIWHGRESRE